MPTNSVRPYLLLGSFATALILSPMLFAQGGRGGAGYAGGAHASPQSFGRPFQTNGWMGHYGSFGGAVVPPVAASSGRGAFTFSRSNHYGNRIYNQGLGYRRYPPGYIPYYAAAYPFLYSYPYFDSFDSSAPPPSGGEAYGPPPEDQPPPELMMELDSIHQELAQLKQRQAESPYGMAPEGAAPAAEPTPTKPPEPPLILVFRDGTRTEVRDFAVVGQVFWDLSGHPTRKFPISQLNLEASIQANEARGVEFPEVPKAK